MNQLALFTLPANCSVDGCQRSVHQKTLRLCVPHYKRKWRHGDPLAGGPARPKAKAGKPVVDFDDGTRCCRDCGEAKPLAEFPRDSGGTKGRRASCKPCHTAGAKAWYAANKDDHLVRVRARYKRDIDKHRARDMQRYERDKDKRIALVVEAGHRRRALLRGADSDRGITVIALRKRDGDSCCYCAQTMTFARGNGRAFVPIKATIEHVVALARGGSHTWANVALACWQCNVRKNAMPLDEWLESIVTSDEVA